MPVYSVFFFFFQAEDGIRDGHVTGVQTCALPILRILEGRHARMVERLAMLRSSTLRARDRMDAYTAELARHGLEQEIGRASCREERRTRGSAEQETKKVENERQKRERTGEDVWTT